MIQARNQDEHELSLSTRAQEQHDENHGGR
jgi:hypothetical protein